MPTQVRRKIRKPLGPSVPGLATGPFSGIAQAGPARMPRANVLAEELLARGCKFIEKQLFDEAETEFRKALKMDGNYAEAYNNLALCLLARGATADAVEALRRALTLFPGWYIAEANLGLALDQLGTFGEAATYYRKVLDKRKDLPAVWLAMGEILLGLGKQSEAESALKSAISQAPKYALAHSRLGDLYLQQEKLKEAEAELVIAHGLDAKDADTNAALGVIAARKGELNKAKDFFAHAHDEDGVPRYAEEGAHRLQVFGRGLVKGMTEWREAQPEAAQLAECLFNLGRAQLKAGNKTAALEAFQNAAVAKPNWTAPLLASGLCAALLGDGAGARRSWEAALKLEPENGVVCEQLGYVLLAMGLPREATDCFKKAAKLGRDVAADIAAAQ